MSAMIIPERSDNQRHNFWPKSERNSNLFAYDKYLHSLDYDPSVSDTFGTSRTTLNSIFFWEVVWYFFRAAILLEVRRSTTRYTLVGNNWRNVRDGGGGLVLLKVLRI